jgi:hypothetical protein
MIAALGSAGLGGALIGLVGVGGALTLFAGAIALIPGTNLNTWLRDNSEAFDKFAGSVENAWLNVRGIDTAQIDNLKTSGDQKKLLGELAVAVNEWVNRLNDVPEEVVTSIELDLEEAFGDIDFYSKTLDELAGTVVETSVRLALTEFFEDVDKAEAKLDPFADKELTKRINLDLTEFFGDVDEAEKKIDEALPSERLLEIKLQGDIDIELQKIKSAAESLQAAFEWDAKIEIANIEADAKRIEAIAGTISTAWESTGDVISAAFGILADPNLPLGDYLKIIRLIEQESSRRDELLKLQIKLTDAEIEHIKARTAALKSGKGIITISSEGIEPELEMVLQKIIKLAQIQANEEGFGMLLGI